MNLNYTAILIATVAQFIVGMIWYGALFGKLWWQILGFDKLSKETQMKMQKAMGPYYALQFLVTMVTTTVLALFLLALPHDWNPYGVAGFFWLGFVVPTQVSSVIFSETPKEWQFTKIVIQAGASLVCLQVAAAILSFMA